MRATLTGRRRPAWGDEEGSALVIAIMVTSVCLSLALLGVQVSLSAGRSSGVDRQRLLAINAAESGVDAAYTAIQQGLLTPPCTAANANVRSGPDVASYSTTITYYDATGASLNGSCTGSPSVLPSTATPARALIRSTASTNTLGGGTTHGQRTMEALVNLAPVNGNSLTKAIFAQGALSFSNQTTLSGNNGSDADIYSSTNVDCSNNENFAGSVYSQGNITMSNKCTFAGNVWAKGSVTTGAGSNGSIAGYVKAGTANISISGETVSGNLYAGTTISYGGCTAGKCFPNSAPGAPPTIAFPILRGDTATMNAWKAGSPYATPPVPGYTVYEDDTCGTVAADIVNTYAQKGTPTLVRTTCAVSFSKTGSIPLSNDLAIFAYGGFSSSQQVGFTSSAAGTTHNLHWVVPYEAGTLPTACTTPSITTSQQFSLSNDVDMFLYSPCSISFANSSTHIGQIYGGGSVTINNQFTMQYRPVPVLGVDPSSQPTISYNPSVVYKRETT